MLLKNVVESIMYLMANIPKKNYISNYNIMYYKHFK